MNESSCDQLGFRYYLLGLINQRSHRQFQLLIFEVIDHLNWSAKICFNEVSRTLAITIFRHMLIGRTPKIFNVRPNRLFIY